jgi:hypothetical protein
MARIIKKAFQNTRFSKKLTLTPPRRLLKLQKTKHMENRSAALPRRGFDVTSSAFLAENKQ